MHDDHDHDDHAPPQKDHDAGPMGTYEVLEEAVRSLLVEKGVLTAEEIARGSAKKKTLNKTG